MDELASELFGGMRNATREEKDSINRYIESILEGKMSDEYEQVSIFEYLTTEHKSMSNDTVRIKGALDTKTLSEYEITSTYRDIFLIINMLDDYVKLLNEQEDKNYNTEYMIQQFNRISEEMALQIGLDKDLMYHKCAKRNVQKDDIGEDAMNLAMRFRKEIR